MSDHCEGVCTPDPMVCALVYGSTREVRRGYHGQKSLIFMHFHEVFLGSQHEIWSEQHNGKVRNIVSTCQLLTFRANFREKMRIALSSWDEHKDHSNPRTSRRHTGHHHAPPENACGRIIGQPLPVQWQLAGLESRWNDDRVVSLYPLRGRPPALSRRDMGQSPSADPQSVPRPTGQTTRPDR